MNPSMLFRFVNDKIDFEIPNSDSERMSINFSTHYQNMVVSGVVRLDREEVGALIEWLNKQAAAIDKNKKPKK